MPACVRGPECGQNGLLQSSNPWFGLFLGFNPIIHPSFLPTENTKTFGVSKPFKAYDSRSKHTIAQKFQSDAWILIIFGLWLVRGDPKKLIPLFVKVYFCDSKVFVLKLFLNVAEAFEKKSQNFVFVIFTLNFKLILFL